jgi:cell division protein FtsL
MQEHYINKKTIKLGLVLVSLAWFVQPLANAQSDAEMRESVNICQRVADLSFRLACYDRAFPPPAETIETSDSMPSRDERVVSGDLSEQQRQIQAERQQLEAERQQLEAERRRVEIEPERDRAGSLVRIVEVEQPNLRTSRFITADGRVYVQSDATRVNRLPEIPFDVEIQSMLAGTTILVIPGPNGRGDQRIRVSRED